MTAQTQHARLYPALLLVAPVVITIVGVASAKFSTLESLATAVAGSGGAFLLTQLARDAGKKSEKALCEAWGGLPSVAIFRHRDGRIDAITKARYHKQLAALIKGTKAPSPEEEATAPATADQVYSAWSTFLRVHTRDTKKFPLVFQENISYGYRRNVCGLKPFGIVVSSLSFAGSAIWLSHLYSATGTIATESFGTLICGRFRCLDCLANCSCKPNARKMWGSKSPLGVASRFCPQSFMLRQ